MSVCVCLSATLTHMCVLMAGQRLYVSNRHSFMSVGGEFQSRQSNPRGHAFLPPPPLSPCQLTQSHLDRVSITLFTPVNVLLESLCCLS